MNKGRYIDNEFVEYTDIEKTIVELVHQALNKRTTTEEGSGWYGGQESVKDYHYDDVADDILSSLMDIGIIYS